MRGVVERIGGEEGGTGRLRKKEGMMEDGRGSSWGKKIGRVGERRGGGEEERPHLSCGHVREHFKDLHPLLHSCHGDKDPVNHVLHHDLQLLHTGTKPVVRVMPAGGVHVQDCLTHCLQS